MTMVASQILVAFRKHWQGRAYSAHLFLSPIMPRFWIVFKIQLCFLTDCLPRNADIWTQKANLGARWSVITNFIFLIGFQVRRTFLRCYLTEKCRSFYTATAWRLPSPRCHPSIQSDCFLPGFCCAWGISTECFIFCHSAEARQRCFLGFFQHL